VLINECGLVTPVPRRLADRDGDRRNPQPWPLTGHRQRLTGSSRHRPQLRAAIHHALTIRRASSTSHPGHEADEASRRVTSDRSIDASGAPAVSACDGPSVPDVFDDRSCRGSRQCGASIPPPAEWTLFQSLVARRARISAARAPIRHASCGWRNAAGAPRPRTGQWM
jgi:hypothetical protein